MHAVIIPKFWVLNEQQQVFVWVVQLGQNQVPHTSWLNTGPSVYDNHVSDLHQLSGVAQMWDLHEWISQLNITTTMIDRIMKSHADYMKQFTENRDTLHSDEPSS
jgi:hypothetical protein